MFSISIKTLITLTVWIRTKRVFFPLNGQKLIQSWFMIRVEWTNGLVSGPLEFRLKCSNYFTHLSKTLFQPNLNASIQPCVRHFIHHESCHIAPIYTWNIPLNTKKNDKVQYFFVSLLRNILLKIIACCRCFCGWFDPKILYFNTIKIEKKVYNLPNYLQKKNNTEIVDMCRVCAHTLCSASTLLL